jgi:YggT family protein
MMLIYYALLLFELVLFARIILSWFPNIDRNNAVIKLIYDITEPVLRPIRSALPRTGVFAMIDLSPLLVILGINLVMSFIF